MVKSFYYKYLQVFISIIAILALYISCSSGAGAGGRDILPPVVTHSIAVTDEGSSLTLTVTATDPSGIAAYSSPVLNLGGDIKEFSVLPDKENTWVYTIVSSDVGKIVTYSNISAIDGAGNQSNVEENLDTGILAGLDHTLTVFNSGGAESPNQTIANVGDTVKLTILAAIFSDITYVYDGSINIGGVNVDEDPRIEDAPSNEFTYIIGPDDVGAITYTASVRLSAEGIPILIADNLLSSIVVVDKTAPVFTAALTTSGGATVATTGDRLSLTVNASDGKGLASATATLKVGEDILQSETIELPTVDGELAKTFTFEFEKIVDASNRGLVSYSIVVTNVDGKTSVTNPEYTPSSIRVNPNELLTARIVGLDADGVTEKMVLKAGDSIQLTTKLAEAPITRTTGTIVYNPSLTIGSGAKIMLSNPILNENGESVFEYTVLAGENGLVMYSVEPTIDGLPAFESIINETSGIRVNTSGSIISDVVLGKVTPNAYGTYAKAGEVIELEIILSDTSTASTYDATMTVGGTVVDIVPQAEENKFRYTVGNENGAVGYSVTVTDGEGNTVTQTNTATGYVVDTIVPTIEYAGISMQRELYTYQEPPSHLPSMTLGKNDELRVAVRGIDSNDFEVKVQMKIGTDAVDAIENLDGTFRYRVQENDNGIVSYSVTLTDVAGNIASERITANFLRYIYINDKTDLIAFANDVNAGNRFAGKIIVLNNNIDLTNSTFGGIGLNNNAFSGTFDGNKKTISNMYITERESTPIGFFGYVENATIKDLTIASGEVNGKQNVGGIAGYAVNSTIIGVRVKDGLGVIADGLEGTDYQQQTTYVGGIVGQSSGTTITHAYSEAWITGRGFVGGLVGFMNSTTIQYAYNAGVVTGQEGMVSSEIGGLVGHVKPSKSTISHVYNIGTLRGVQLDMGGIIGQAQSASTTLSNAFNDFKGIEDGRYRGQIIGRVVSVVSLNTILRAPIYRRSGSLQAIGIIGSDTVGSNTNESGAADGTFDPWLMGYFNETSTADFFIDNVFNGDTTNWIRNNTAGSYPTLKYFEGWN